MSAMTFSFPIFKALTTTGTLGPLAGGLLHTFEAGTSTPLAVFQDDALTVPHTNPVVLDSNGQATIYLGPNAYKMRLEDSTGAVQPGWPIDGIEDPLDNAKDYTDVLRSDLAASSGSSLVGFLQSGTGSVARTVQDKARESVSVKDFGAVGDGVTNDTAAIQAAFDAHDSVFFPDGVYKISGTHVHMTGRSGVSITGPGKILRTDVGRILYLDTCAGVIVSGLKIEGEGATYNASGNGIWLQGCTDFQVVNNTVEKANRQGINIEASTDGVVQGNICKYNWQDGIMVRTGSNRVTVTGNTCHNNGDTVFAPPVGEGIHLYEVSDCTVSGNVSYANSDHGISAEGADYCTVTGNTSSDNVVCGMSINTGTLNVGVGSVVSNNTFKSNGSDGIIISAADDYVVAENVIADNTGYGIKQGIGSGPSQDRVIIRGNKIYGNGSGGILHDWNNVDCVISGNMLRGAAGRGILINRAQSVDTVISDNNIKGFPTAQITDNGTTSRIFNNDLGNKLSGRSTLVAGTFAVVWTVAEPSANFCVATDVPANETIRITGKSATGFTITSSNGASTAQIAWKVVDSKTTY